MLVARARSGWMGEGLDSLSSAWLAKHFARVARATRRRHDQRSAGQRTLQLLQELIKEARERGDRRRSAFDADACGTDAQMILIQRKKGSGDVDSRRRREGGARADPRRRGPVRMSRWTFRQAIQRGKGMGASRPSIAASLSSRARDQAVARWTAINADGDQTMYLTQLTGNSLAGSSKVRVAAGEIGSVQRKPPPGPPDDSRADARIPTTLDDWAYV